MWNLFLFLSASFVLVFLLGPLIEKMRVPWIFGALLVGGALAVYNPYPAVMDQPAFGLLAELGMYFLLFIIGLEIDLEEIRKLGRLIFRTTLVTIFLATLFGSLFIHFVFGTSWMAATLVALSFGTVGEAILVPILDEFKIIHTRLGQAIIGVATLDDIAELVALVWLSLLLGVKDEAHTSIGIEVLAFVLLLVLTGALFLLKRFLPRVKMPEYNGLVIFFMLIIFLAYTGIGQWAGMEALAAILAGVGIKHVVTPAHFQQLETHTKLLTYGFLAPIFFLKIGMEMNVSYLINNLWLVVLIVLISNSAKMLGSWATGRRELGMRKSTLMGLALSIRFSTSIVIVTVLYQNQLIKDQLFSVLIASSIIFTFINPPLFANLLVRWKVVFNPEKND